jgi:hypothetical protein
MRVTRNDETSQLISLDTLSASEADPHSRAPADAPPWSCPHPRRLAISAAPTILIALLITSPEEAVVPAGVAVAAPACNGR